MNTIAAYLIIRALGPAGGHTISTSGKTGRYVVGGLATWSNDVETIEKVGIGANAIHAHNQTRHVSGDTIGSWLDTETGIVYVDKGTVHDDLTEALRFAADRGELAIWDTETSTEIRTETNR